MNRRTIRQWIPLGIVVGILAVWMIDRYRYLHIEADNTRFFHNATTVLSLLNRDALDPRIPSIPESYKSSEQNPLPAIHHTLFPQTSLKALVDPFLPSSSPNRYIHLQYGYVEHTQWTPPPGREPNSPLWFVWSAGRSDSEPEMIQSVRDDGIRLFRFQSAPYQITNGINSLGYLYSDSKANQVGKIR